MSDATIDFDNIRWRVSNTWEREGVKWGMLVGYIDARTCMEALDALDPEWQAEHGDPIIVGTTLMGVPCRLTVNGVTRSDVGMPSSQEPIKGAYSDALKRAAVHFGIGRELYELPKIAVECEVGRDGKVKAPKALPFYRDGQWSINKTYGYVRYDRTPNEQPDGGERVTRTLGRRTESRQPATTRRPVTKGEALDRLAEVMRDHGLKFAHVDQLAKEQGIDRGTGTAEDILRLVALIETPAASVPPASAGPGESGGSVLTPPTDTASMDGTPERPGGSSESSTPTDPAAVPPSAAGSGLTLDDVLAVTGGELVPPRPGTDQYRAMTATERANAKAYWQREDAKPQPTLAEAMGAPESD